ncbi:MAG TPA: NAD-glutamate dehydrogenase domain-containing protein, partial [Candidatus Binatia bacterium]|nr:NAD-glutamate dehydrogenase domain-containing protein [Candidatus Binatia bacterium]
MTTILPRDRFSGEIRLWIEDLLADRLGGPVVDYQLSFGGEQARLHFYVAAPESAAAVRVEELERAIGERARSWDDRLRERLVAEFRGARGRALAERYAKRFTPEYKAATEVAAAVTDIRHIESLAEAGSIDVDLAAAPGTDADRFTMLKLYLRGEGIVLSDFLPLLENLGLRVFAEDSVTLGEDEDRIVLIRFLVQDRRGQRLDVARTAPTLAPAILEIRAGRAESDPLNRLIVDAGFAWREVDLLRTYRNLAFQANAAPSRPALNDVLLRRPDAARALFELFAARFDPAVKDRETGAQAARDRFATALEAVDTASEDQMLRNLLQLVDGTLRTNYFRPARIDHPFLAVKIHSREVAFLQKPRPLYEVYVHSARMEGLHLRGGKVARGGIRWSDRPDDFRTEILGLMKTQMVKNAVIVPVGSKGGFVVKRQRGGEEAAAEVRECYSTLMRGLLELTDNIVRGEVSPPPAVVRYDDDDPYLVVAADKGTATFSDLANAIAAENGFWLGDAFASGGSHGYDHKKEGITARGAWECVERHFRELGKDIQKAPFDVVGIGDMSGDVFGNGMLLSRAIRLRAAFNHAHVFLDPNPDPEASFRERERLFRLPRSAWTDYDRAVLSRGGMIIARGSKATAVSPEVRAMLGIDRERLDGEGLIRAALSMKTDLLFNGGIGTYVRASTETDAEVGDHANDGVRRSAAEIGAAAVGEGGNLGFTQRARIEFGLRSGRIDTDAIDNSGGVDLSDHEVNLKILFQPLLESGELTFAQRNRILEEAKPDVIAHVLSHN